MKSLFVIVTLLLINCSFIVAQSNPPQVSTQTAKAKTNEESPAQRAEAILKLAREAKGGEEKLKQVRDLIYSGDYFAYNPSGTDKQPLTMFLYQAQKVRTDVGTISSGFDGQTPWFNDTVQSGQAAYETRRRAIREWFISLLIVPNEIKMSALALPDSEIDGKPVVVVAVEIGECKFKISFDKQTYLARQLSYGMMNGTQEEQIDELQEDYKTVGGIKFAHRQIGLELGRIAGEVKVEEYKINSKIDPVKFTRQ